jgi:hypothetical protein
MTNSKIGRPKINCKMNKWTLITIVLLSFILSSSINQKLTTQNEMKKDNFRVVAFYMGDGRDIEQYEIDKLTHLIFCLLIYKAIK